MHLNLTNYTENEVSIDLKKASIKVAISIGILLIVRIIVTNLPMIRELPRIGIGLSWLNLVKMMIDTIILIFILNFGREVKNFIEQKYLKFPELGKVAFRLILVFVLVIGYSTYKALGYVLFGSDMWIYSILFVILIVIPLIAVGKVLINNADKIYEIFSVPQETKVSSTSSCPKCGKEVSKNTKFCPECGAEIAKKESPTCPNCGKKVAEGVKFCPDCGAKI